MKPRFLFFLLPSVLFSGAAFAGVWDKPTPELGHPTAMTVYRSPSCGCCGKWIERMKKQGFVVKEIQDENMEAVKRKLGVPKELESCHTAEVEGYLVEGHTPAADVKKMLLAKPKALGLATPGMPMGSPGMEMGDRRDKFSVLIFDRQGNVDKFNEY
jgi:hypothetical protein